MIKSIDSKLPITRRRHQSGSCRIEAAAADYLAGRTDWDFITCELGVNMRNEFSPGEFEKRVHYLVEALTTRQPMKSVILISPFTSDVDFLKQSSQAVENTTGYRRALETVTGEFSSERVLLIDGRELLPDVSGLNCDLVHPSTEGHSQIAGNLARILPEILESQK